MRTRVIICHSERHGDDSAAPVAPSLAARPAREGNEAGQCERRITMREEEVVIRSIVTAGRGATNAASSHCDWCLSAHAKSVIRSIERKALKPPPHANNLLEHACERVESGLWYVTPRPRALRRRSCTAEPSKLDGATANCTNARRDWTHQRAGGSGRAVLVLNRHRRRVPMARS